LRFNKILQNTLFNQTQKKMTTMILGASGATGRLLVEQLLNQKHKVKIIVRAPEKLPDSWKTNKLLTIIKASVADIGEERMADYLSDCQAVASCLGHNISFNGLFGAPRTLVTDAVELTCNAIKINKLLVPIKLVLMNTTGNRNKDLDEPISGGEQFVVGLIRLLLPPHVDNEQAAEYLRTKIGQKDQHIEWAAVRPDGLVDEDSVSKYDVYPSPIRSAIFNAGKTSRINVGHFMAQLITDHDLWNTWKGQMPVIYNKANT
jgi:nucleoside-diphosphate-sugar epimerase